MLLILLAWGGYSGFKKGLVLEIFSIGALVLAVLGSMRLLEATVALCTRWYPDQQKILPYVVFVFLFVTITITTTWVGKLLKALIKPTLLGNLDRLWGSALGIFKWSVYSSTALWLGNWVALEIPETYTADTILFPIIKAIVPQLLTWYVAWLPYIPEWLTKINMPQHHDM